MSAVMQHSFQGPVRLYSEKAAEHLAVVTVGSLTSTAVEMGPRGHLAEGTLVLRAHVLLEELRLCM